MNITRIFKKLESISKKIIPAGWHPFFTPAKNFFMLRDYNRLTGIWFITWTCNFKCPYCWQREDPDIYRRKYDLTAEDWLKAWQNIANDFDEIILGISGGEPFFIKGFMKLLDQLPGNIRYDITSNLSFNVEKFLAIKNVKKNCSGIVCSFHPTSFEDPSDYIQDFFRKVKKLTILPNTRVNFVAVPPNLKYYDQIKKFTQENRIPLHMDKYSPLGAGLPFTDEECAFARKIVSTDRTNSTVEAKPAVLCNGGVSHITLFPNGNAFPCLKKGKLMEDLVGSFIHSGFQFNKNWIKCSYYPQCDGCDLDNIQIKPLSDQSARTQ